MDYLQSFFTLSKTKKLRLFHDRFPSTETSAITEKETGVDSPSSKSVPSNPSNLLDDLEASSSLSDHDTTLLSEEEEDGGEVEKDGDEVEEDFADIFVLENEKLNSIDSVDDAEGKLKSIEIDDGAEDEELVYPSNRCEVKVMPLKNRVIKTFNNTMIGRTAFNREVQMYTKLAQSTFIRNAIPQCLQFIHQDYRIVYKYCGVDTLTLAHEHNMQMESVDLIRKCMKQLVPVFSEMHKLHLYHGDVKPDNIVFDGDRFRLIDYDMSSYVPDFRIMKRSFTGTIPYASPFRFEHDNVDARDCLRWNDYYGFAMTILYFFGSREQVRMYGEKCCVVPIAQLRYAFVTGRLHDPIYKNVYPFKPRYAPVDYDSNFLGPDVPIMKAIAGLILSQIDHSYDLLVWDHCGKRYYQNHDASVVFSSLVRMDESQLETPDFYWSQLLDLIRLF